MRVLVTTALEQAWPEEEPVLFLGEWCRRFSRRGRWQDLDVEVMPYHWDDRDRFDEDFVHLAEVYERFLRGLASMLNERHGVDHGLRYWRILVGPWLGAFLQMAWDRWRMVSEASLRTDVSRTIVLDGLERSVVPGDMAEFVQKFQTDEWNHDLYRRILEAQGRIPIVRRAHEPEGAAVAALPQGPETSRVALLRRWSTLAARMARRSDVAVVSPWMSWSAELALHLRLRQVPLVWAMVGQPSEAFAAGDRRGDRQGELLVSPIDDFEQFARRAVPDLVPAAYLEGYGRLVEMTTEAPWPRTPRVVFTCNAHYSNDVFKAWTAERVEAGARLVTGQHGGNFGTSRRVFFEDHEVAVADRYLTWGWSDPARPRIRPVGQIMDRRPLGVDHGTNDRLLLVTTTMPRQSYFLLSGVVAGQWLGYLEDQFAFVEALPVALQDSVTVRLLRHDYGWDQQDRWRDRLPGVELEPGVLPMRDLVARCRVYVATYNATTFLETFAMDVPTVMFWNPEHWEVRDSAGEVFEALREVGILHDSPVSAAGHLASIWEDPTAWWGGAEVRAARRRFDEELNWHGHDVVGAIAREIADVAGGRGRRRPRAGRTTTDGRDGAS